MPSTEYRIIKNGETVSVYYTRSEAEFHVEHWGGTIKERRL